MEIDISCFADNTIDPVFFAEIGDLGVWDMPQYHAN